jgi:aromatic ring-cleaving dioxygenase
MKKVLLGSTAIVAAGLIASAPAAAAEKLSAKVGGYMEQWVGYTSVDEGNNTNDNTGFDVKSDSEIHFKGSTVLDNGIEFGINVQLEANTSGDQIDESYMIIKGSFGEINIGSENSAMYKMHYAPSEFGIGINSGDQVDWTLGAGSSIGTSGTFRAPFGSTYVEPDSQNDTEKLTYYTPRFAGFQIGASYAPNTSEDNNTLADSNASLTDGVMFGANYVNNFGGFDVAVSGGYGTFLNSPSGSDEPEAYSAGITLGYAGFGVGASWARFDDQGTKDGDGYNIGVSYETGPFGVSLNYFNGERDGGGTTANTVQADNDTFMLSGKYALGPGVTAAATLGHSEYNSSVAGVEDVEATYFVTGIRLSF